MFGSRILLLIPHPDDEVVGCAAAIARARARGARVFALYLSHGCIPLDDFWSCPRSGYEARVARRCDEGHKAADFLGLTFVGANKQRPARRLWRELSAVRTEVLAAMSKAAPDRIWVPAYEGGNPDHDGLNALASTLPDVPVFEFSEYNFAGGRARSNCFIKDTGGVMLHSLTPEERQMKRQALALYKSERGNVSGLKTEQEQFRPLAAYDYSKRPHAGKLWYERFQWVPFRHPRVDYTRAEEVSAAITAFLKKSG